jgi:hypothetical protein
VSFAVHLHTFFVLVPFFSQLKAQGSKLKAKAKQKNEMVFLSAFSFELSALAAPATPGAFP